MKILAKILAFTAAGLALCACNSLNQSGYETVRVAAPFDMPDIVLADFPSNDFPITDFGAKSGGKIDNTNAIAAAIDACSKAGGGRVVVPAGIWKTGPIHLKSNVNLYLSDNSELVFSGNPADYLPAVLSSWEGIECYNYSPLIYAVNCQNIAITGKGTLRAEMQVWKTWMGRPQAHIDALRQLYTYCSTNAPVETRQMAVGENHLRPQFIQFNRCKNIRLENFKIVESPFWTIHIFLSENGLIRNVNIKALEHNNDGVDFECSKNFLVENCTFYQGDDAIVIKSLRNHDGWRIDTPSKNIVARNCTVKAGHALLVIGSELSGGVKNILAENCQIKDSPDAKTWRVLRIKTNERRGGVVDNIYIRNVSVDNVSEGVVSIETDALFQWKDFPTYETRLTKIGNVFAENITCKSANYLCYIDGESKLPPENISLKNIKVDKIKKFPYMLKNCKNLSIENADYGTIK